MRRTLLALMRIDHERLDGLRKAGASELNTNEVLCQLTLQSVVRKLKHGQPCELGWGLVLRPPTDSSSPGEAGGYRYDCYDAPIREDGTRGARRGSSARHLATARHRATAQAAEFKAKMRTQETGHRLDMTFGELPTHYLEPAPE